DMDLASEIEILLALGVAHGAAGNKPAPFAALFGQEPGAIVQLARLQRVYGLRRSEQIAAVDGGVGHAYPGVIDTVSNGHGQKNHRHDGSAHNASAALELFILGDIGIGGHAKNLIILVESGAKCATDWCWPQQTRCTTPEPWQTTEKRNLDVW